MTAASTAFASESSAQNQAKCRGKVATIVGTPGNDMIKGTPGRDIIAGLGGNDVILGAGGNDLICGGAGNDRINGGNGNDVILGQRGWDTMLGAAGADQLIGGPGRDVANGQAGRDRCSAERRSRCSLFAKPKKTPPVGTTFANCTEVREQGYAPLRKGEPGYNFNLDRDRDGIACEV